ncbi:hypothetical protein SYNTR_1167 [Candidatus Syntrophocurvum alkaliphilum]|uniref:Uncharacterized protein n=1 Tax=Candidatus Syntrophocurvum alkaliphilum TaxID=2293317 RepID=A0A6I6DHD3_9FIRM|nr:PD-(D/E)XK nuclease family protein [Candidatus Syntrophocurvum alkaliphilum]QGT99760.1 hypothetical protein SYNTR_1167 [Candidatus Syntrophocurvum alkaliphilum]
MNKLYLGNFHSNMRKELVIKCADSIRNGMKAIYILPSREAMFDVRELFIKELGGLYNCYILTFTDLEEMLTTDLIRKNNVLSEYEVGLVIRKILEKQPKNFLFNRVKAKSGFISGVKQTIRKLKRLHISPEELNEKALGIDGTLGVKLKAIAKIYKDYENYKKGMSVYDLDDFSVLALNQVQNSKILDETRMLVIDGFINIDPVDVNLIKEMINRTDIDIHINVPFKNEYNMDFIYSEIIKDFSNLDFKVEVISSDKPYINPDLRCISQQIYSNKRDLEVLKSSVIISKSPCIDYEIRQTAREIKKLLIEKMAKPDDIAVFCNNNDEYSEKVKDVFDEYGLPININQRNNLLTVPLIKDILCVLRLRVKDYIADSFVTLLTSKYILPKQIQSSDYYESSLFRKLAKKVINEHEPEDYFDFFKQLLVEECSLEDIPVELEDYFNVFDEFNPENTDGQVEALQEFIKVLSNLDLRNQLTYLYEEGVISQDVFIRDLTALQGFEKVIKNLINTWVRFEPIKPVEWLDSLHKELVKLLSEEQTGLNNRDYGGVKFLNPDLARGQDYDTVFILGINEGIFPSSGNGNYLFNADEILELAKLNINLGTPLWELQREKIRFNACLATARNRLNVSYRVTDENGALMIPSGFINDFTAILTEECCEKVTFYSVSMRKRMRYNVEPASKVEAIRKLNTNLWNNGDVQLINEYAWLDSSFKEKLLYSSRAAYMEISREFNPVFDEFDGRLNNPKLSQQDAWYGFSPSQLNSYVYCPFRYFAERVLNLDDDEQEPLSGLSIGLLYHEVLKQYYEGKDDPEEVDIERLQAVFDSVEKDFDYGNQPQIVKDYYRSELFNTIKAFIYHDADNLTRYFEATGFRLKPVLLEKFFQIYLGDNKIRGVADRVDLEFDDTGSFTGRYIIYDYKKGNVKTIKECIETEDFQLPIYYAAFDNYIKKEYAVSKTECIALLYYSIEKLEWKGIIRKDMKLALFEKRKRPQLIDENNMYVLLEWVEGEVLKTIDEIKKGFFSPKECPATYFVCPYNGMCRYDKIRFEGKGV